MDGIENCLCFIEELLNGWKNASINYKPTSTLTTLRQLFPRKLSIYFVRAAASVCNCHNALPHCLGARFVDLRLNALFLATRMHRVSKYRYIYCYFNGRYNSFRGCRRLLTKDRTFSVCLSERKILGGFKGFESTAGKMMDCCFS